MDTYVLPDLEEIAGWFDNPESVKADLEGARVIYASYETGSYEGSWEVVYVDKDGVYCIDSGGHCSCNGPEWGPQTTTLDALKAGNPNDDLRAQLDKE